MVSDSLIYESGNKSSDYFTASPDKYPQGYFKDKPCRLCETLFKPIAPSHLYCSDDCANKAYTNTYLKKAYGITLAQYEDLYKSQNALCAICGGEGFSMKGPSTRKLVLDHCHQTGKVRGFLCHNCNRALGLFHDNKEHLQKALNYLDEQPIT